MWGTLSAAALRVASTVLQSGGGIGGSQRTLLTAYELVGALLGLFIAYQAYRGYRRNDSRPMLFIAVGFVLVVGVPVLLLPAFFLLPSVPQFGFQAAIQTFEVAGLLSIIYALRVNPRE